MTLPLETPPAPSRAWRVELGVVALIDLGLASTPSPGAGVYAGFAWRHLGLRLRGAWLPVVRESVRSLDGAQTVAVTMTGALASARACAETTPGRWWAAGCVGADVAWLVPERVEPSRAVHDTTLGRAGPALALEGAWRPRRWISLGVGVDVAWMALRHAVTVRDVGSTDASALRGSASLAVGAVW